MDVSLRNLLRARREGQERVTASYCEPHSARSSSSSSFSLSSRLCAFWLLSLLLFSSALLPAVNVRHLQVPRLVLFLFL